MSENTNVGSSTAARDGKDRLALPFDQYQRYKVISDSLDLLRENTEPLRILDVGGAEGMILDFLTDDEVTILDQIEAEGVPNFVLGDALALPFDDDSFDYAVSVDVFEHIPAEAREKYLSELRRVARRGVLLAAPFDSEEVRGAERLANEFHRSVHQQENVWLAEHAENELPDLDPSRRFFEERGDWVTVVPNGYLPHWLAMISFTFYRPRLTDGMQEMFDRLNAFYNEFMYRHDNADPSYRHLVVALKDGQGAGDLAGLVSSSGHPDPTMSAALFSTFSSTLSLAPQINSLNERLAQKEDQLVRKDEQLARQATVSDERALLDQLTRKDSQLAQKEAQIRDLSKRFAQQTTSANNLAQLKHENASLRAQRNQFSNQLNAIQNSRTWRLIDRQRRFRIFLKAQLEKRSGGNGG